MNQNIWGSHLWFSLHTITFNYPLKPTDEDKQNYKNYFTNIKHVIPCSVCKKNYIRHLNELPIDNVLDSKKKLVYWLIDMHNMVNGEIGKKILSYDVVIKKYENAYNKKLILDINDSNDSNNNNDNNNDNNNIESFSNKNNESNENNENKINENKIMIYYFFTFFIFLLIINFIVLLLKKNKL